MRPDLVIIQFKTPLFAKRGHIIGPQPAGLIRQLSQKRPHSCGKSGQGRFQVLPNRRAHGLSTVTPSRVTRARTRVGTDTGSGWMV